MQKLEHTMVATFLTTDSAIQQLEVKVPIAHHYEVSPYHKVQYTSNVQVKQQLVPYKKIK